MTDIIMSIKKEYCDLIKFRKKKYEFRTRLPKSLPISKIYVYEMLPTSSLKYILLVGEPVIYPDIIKSDISYGVASFNAGDTKNKVAYPIYSMHELIEPIPKDILLEKYGMVPPQSYVYIDTYDQIRIDIDDHVQQIF